MTLVRAIEEYAANPRPGGGIQPGRRAPEQHFDAGSDSMRVEQMTGHKLDWRYVDEGAERPTTSAISQIWGNFGATIQIGKITRGTRRPYSKRSLLHNACGLSHSDTL